MERVTNNTHIEILFISTFAELTEANTNIKDISIVEGEIEEVIEKIESDGEYRRNQITDFKLITDNDQNGKLIITTSEDTSKNYQLTAFPETWEIYLIQFIDGYTLLLER